jgi:hypothetical protein
MTGHLLRADDLDGPRSVVRDEAENRRHALTAVLCRLMGRRPARSS